MVIWASYVPVADSLKEVTYTKEEYIMAHVLEDFHRLLDLVEVENVSMLKGDNLFLQGVTREGNHIRLSAHLGESGTSITVKEIEADNGAQLISVLTTVAYELGYQAVQVFLPSQQFRLVLHALGFHTIPQTDETIWRYEM